MNRPLGEILRELRDQKDISLRQTAQHIGITAVHLSDIEGGRRYPSDKVLESLAIFFSYPLEELRKSDSRPPVDEIKRLASTHPSVGFAFRTAMDEVKAGKVSPDELAKRLRGESR